MQSGSLQMESNRAVLCLLKISWRLGICMSAPQVHSLIYNLIASPLTMVFQEKTSPHRECSATHSELSKRSHEWSFIHTANIYLKDEVTSLMEFTAWWRDTYTGGDSSKCQLLWQEVQKKGSTEERALPLWRWARTSEEVRFPGCIWRGLKELAKSEQEQHMPWAGDEMGWAVFENWE